LVRKLSLANTLQFMRANSEPSVCSS
jgi:hypothetical protein